MRADNSRHLTAAAARRGQDTMARAQTAIQRMRQAQGPLTVAEFCRAARVSRSWLYTQPALLQELASARPAASPTEPADERASDQSLLNRLQVAHQRNRELTAEITELREQIAVLYGRLRDVELRGGGRAVRQIDTVERRPAPPESPQSQSEGQQDQECRA